jgi:hypothetical protein
MYKITTAHMAFCTLFAWISFINTNRNNIIVRSVSFELVFSGIQIKNKQERGIERERERRERERASERARERESERA